MIMLLDPAHQRESASLGCHVSQYNLNMQVWRRQGALGFIAVRRLENGKATFAQIFGQRMTDNNIRFDKKDDRRGRCHWSPSFCPLLSARSARLVAVSKRL